MAISLGPYRVPNKSQNQPPSTLAEAPLTMDPKKSYTMNVIYILELNFSLGAPKRTVTATPGQKCPSLHWLGEVYIEKNDGALFRHRDYGI